MKRMYAGRPGITFTTTPLGFSSGGGGTARFSEEEYRESGRAEDAGILGTQNDVLNEPGFVFSLVLQHTQVISGNGRLGRRLGCKTNDNPFTGLTRSGLNTFHKE